MQNAREPDTLQSAGFFVSKSHQHTCSGSGGAKLSVNWAHNLGFKTPVQQQA